jgi:subtilisin family serine protease
MADAFYYNAKGQKVPLRPSTRSLAIAYREGVPQKDLEALIRGDDRLAQFIISPELTERNLVLFRRPENAAGAIEDFAARLLASNAIRYVSIVHYRGTSAVVITDEFVAQFKPEVTRPQIDALNAANGVEIARVIDFAPNTFVLRVRQPQGFTGSLETANRYFESGLTVYSEPNFIHVRETRFRPNDPFYPNQWHLPRIQAEEAWDITRGDPSVIIAVIDDGVDIDHEDFAGAGKIVAGRDVLDGDDNPRPGAGDDHGTAASGVAVADGNNSIGVSGMAPGCRLMPIRLLGAAQTDVREADAFNHAVASGAAIISNSWGPTDRGGPQALPGIVGTAFDNAITTGRGGLGCIIMFASGNGNESVSSPATFDGYAADNRVIAVAAVNDQNIRSSYSDFGPEVDVCAPSDGSTSGGIVGPVFPDDGSTLGIFTTDRTAGDGYNNTNAPAGVVEGSPDRNYTSTFGGTSSACPLAAGVVGLMLSAAPDLTRDQVVFVLEATSDKVDEANTDPIGRYQPNGHSEWYGFGRVNAFEAVKGARSSVPDRDFVHSVQVTLRRTTGDRFVATKTIRAIDARQRRAETATDIFIRGGPDGFLRAEMAGAFDEVEVNP